MTNVFLRAKIEKRQKGHITLSVFDTTKE